MDDTTVMVATTSVRVTVGGRTVRVRRGLTTAHAGAEIVQAHPHLWRPLDVDHPVTVKAAVVKKAPAKKAAAKKATGG